jgi:nucleotide-binding universal stress UspA family protein
VALQGRSPLIIDAAIRQSRVVTETPGADRAVVVGVDGSAGSAVALQWAIDHADHLGVVEPVMAFSAGLYTVGFGSFEGEDEAGGPYRYDAFLRLRAFLLEHAPSLVDVGRVVEGRAGAALLDAATGSELLVLGTRGWSSRIDLSLGSVGAYCARHSTVPVALIPPEVRPIHDRLDVVVGFDGSPHALAALQWALGHLRRSARVTAVRVYTSEAVAGDPSSPSSESSTVAAHRELECEVAAVLTDFHTHPEVELLVVAGDPRAALRAVADDADLLVIGSRGLGALDQLLIGSVAIALAHHPMVPTIVVPHTGHDDF